MVRWMASGLLAAVACAGNVHAADKPFVPGTGSRVASDDFEAGDWQYIRNGAKASYEQDESQRPPGGRSKNGRWYESAMRGQPDVVRRIATPPGGLEGSKGSLFLATMLSGIPGDISRKQMQDDLLMGVKDRIGTPIPVAWRPSVVVRVYLPAFERWENRSGSSFGIRGDVRGRNVDGTVEPYWPGMFILFRSETSQKYDHDHAQITVRAGNNGRDVPGPVIEEPGWWTFGLAFTPDGAVHYYASPGIDDLTDDDHLYSATPYGTRCLFFDNFMINVANLEDGRTWSTPWVIDDPTVYVVPPPGRTVQHLIRGGDVANRQQQSSTPRTAFNRLFNSGGQR